MLKLFSVTALASALVLSTAAVTPVSAGGHGRMMGGGGHYNFSAHRYGGRMSVHHGPRYIGRLRVVGHPHHPPHPHHHFHWRHGSYWTVGVPVAVGVAGVATYAASGPAPVCTCLTKDYLDDGSVRFTDTCTKEYAVAMPPEQAPVK
jgi:hypothetical protein